MNNNPNIHQLLYNYDCVILPGFGAFITNYKSAVINPDQQSFSPPTKTIVFNRNVSTNDGLLINHFARTNGISYKEATTHTERYVTDLKIKLGRKEKVIIEKVGVLFYDQHQKLQFEPVENVNYLLDAFGLSTFHFPSLEGTLTVKKVKTSKKEFAEATSRIPILRVAAMIAVAMLLSILPYNSTTTRIRSNMTSMYSSFTDSLTRCFAILLNNPNSVSQSIDQMTNKRVALYYEEEKHGQTTHEPMPLFEDSIENLTTSPQNSNASTATTELSNPELSNNTTVTVANELSEMFCIIAGSFPQISQANDFIRMMQGKGFNAELIFIEEGKFRVSIGKFKTKDLAKAEREKLLARNIETWILTTI